MSSNAERFGQIVRDRRLHLDLNQLEVAAAGGPSNSTQTEIENGRVGELTRATAKKIDKGLQWEPGSARVVWQGGDPTPLPATTHVSRGSARDAVRTFIVESAIDDALRQRLLAVIDAESEVRGA